MDGVGEALEKIPLSLGKEGHQKGVDAKLEFIGGEAEGQPGRVSHGKGRGEWCCKCLEVWSKGGGRVCSGGNQEGDRSSLIDLCGDREGEGTVGISEDARSHLWECGSYQGGFIVFRGGRARSVVPSFCRGE